MADGGARLGRVRAVARATLRRFKRDRRGVSAVEFGLVGVPFLGLLGAIFETGFVFLNSVGLQAAVQTAARSILTGNAQAASATVSNADQFRSTYLCPTNGSRVLPSFIDCTKLIIDVRPATSLSTADTSKSFYNNAASQQFCPGAPGTPTVVRVVYPMPVFLPIVAQASSIFSVSAGLVSDVPNNPGLKHLLLATAIFQTELYAAANYTRAKTC